MTTSANNHRPATVAAAAIGCVGALLSVTFTNAHAVPERLDPPTVVDRTVHGKGHYVERACFIKPLTWSEALDGPLPRCHTYVA